MGRKPSGKNYRRIFEDYYGFEIPDGYVIHHIDLNHDNNDIDNLLLLPNSLHARYHMCINSIRDNRSDCEAPDGRILIDVRIWMYSSYELQMVEHLVETLRECERWYAIRDEKYRGYFKNIPIDPKGDDNNAGRTRE